MHGAYQLISISRLIDHALRRATDSPMWGGGGGGDGGGTGPNFDGGVPLVNAKTAHL